MHRRRDQMELLRVKDVFTRQSLTERWLMLGTVVIVPDDRDLPTFYLAGVRDPKQVMDALTSEIDTNLFSGPLKIGDFELAVCAGDRVSRFAQGSLGGA